MAGLVEPWLRGTHIELDALRRQVVHALELTAEDGERWCLGLTAAELNLRPYGLPSVGFQMLHIGRSLDRLLTYAEGHALTEGQRLALSTEMIPLDPRTIFHEFTEAIRGSQMRVRAFAKEMDEETRYVGRDRLPTTVGGLLIHCAEHTQRHCGQMVTTAKVVLAMRETAERTEAER